jgi:membrane protein
MQPVKAWWRRRIAPSAVWRALLRYQEHDMGDRAAGLSYYGALAIFPALIVALTVLGLVGAEGLTRALVRFARDQGASTATAQVVESVTRTATHRSSGALSVALIVSLLLGLNAASGVWGAAGRGMNLVHDVREDRSFVRRRLIVLGLTLVAIVLFLLSLVAVLIGGDWARSVWAHIGLGSQAASVWDIARWPVALLFALAALSVVMRYAPAPEARRSALVTTGAIVTVVVWVLASFGFSAYVRNFSSYGAVYGTFSTVVVLLVWLYLLAAAFLYGAELDGEIARRRAAVTAADGP